MRAFVLCCLSVAAIAASAQLNITEVGHLDYQALHGSDLSNLWGYTDELGNEYALVGVDGSSTPGTGGISVVSLADPANPMEIFFYAGPNSIWREVKVWNDHAYITTEAESGGITIVDLSPLPQSTALQATLWQAPNWSTAHSLNIDENGRLYVHGTNFGNGGAIMYDLTDPMAPAQIGIFDTWYCHDSYAKNNIFYGAHIYDGFFSIVDVSDPANPVLLGTQHTPGNFTHNTWTDGTGNYLFTTDEVTNSYVGAYDVSDPTDIMEVDRLQTAPGTQAIVHNTYWTNNKVIQSYYTEGVSIYDATYPDNLIEVGHYDTSPFAGGTFNGAWGVYPFFSSGLLIVSDIEGGLYVLGPLDVQPCWLNGTITDALTTFPISGATISVVGLSIDDVSATDGHYATGTVAAGAYSIVVSAPGYISATINNVQLVNGQVTVENVSLTPLTAFPLQGSVVTAGTGVPVPFAFVELTSGTYNYNVTTDANGIWQLPAIFADVYSLTAGKWGWHTACTAAQALAQGSGPLTTQLDPGYADNMVLDLGWTNDATATTGSWVRDVPVATNVNGTPSNPGIDAAGDCGGQAYITGNGGGAAGFDDVDDGEVGLHSPLFDATGGMEPHVRYARWFYNGGGTGTPNDHLVISLSNGTDTVAIETVVLNTPGLHTWVAKDFRVLDFIAPTADMQFHAMAVDDAPGHIVEGGLDVFELYYANNAGVEEVAAIDFALWPNPNAGAFTFTTNNAAVTRMEVMDATGRVVHAQGVTASQRHTVDLDLKSGAYLVRAISTDGRVGQKRVVVVR